MADGQRHLSFNISETKYGTIHLATDIAITSKGLVDRPKKEIYCHIPLNTVLFHKLYTLILFVVLEFSFKNINAL